MGEAKRREEARAAEAAAAEKLLEQIRAEDWAGHVAALYEEIAALSTALGLPTPKMRAAGLDPGGPGTILASMRQLAAATRQCQELIVDVDARSRALVDIVCGLSPARAPMYRASIQTAIDIARQERDPDKVAARANKRLVTN